MTFDKPWSRRYINAEYPCDVLIEAAYRAANDRERKLCVSFIVQLLDFWIERGTANQLGDQAEWMTACQAAHHCLREPACRNEVWDWLRQLTREIPDDDDDEVQKARIKCGIFHLIPEEPMNWDDPDEMFLIDQFFQCLQDETTCWVVFEGYEFQQGEKFRSDLARYDRWCLAHGRPRPPLTEAEIDHWAQYYDELREADAGD